MSAALATRPGKRYCIRWNLALRTVSPHVKTDEIRLRLEEILERLTRGRAQREGGGLGNDAIIERRRLDHARERGSTFRREQLPRSQGLLAEEMVEVLKQQRQPRNLEMPVYDLPIETPNR